MKSSYQTSGILDRKRVPYSILFYIVGGSNPDSTEMFENCWCLIPVLSVKSKNFFFCFSLSIGIDQTTFDQILCVWAMKLKLRVIS